MYVCVTPDPSRLAYCCTVQLFQLSLDSYVLVYRCCSRLRGSLRLVGAQTVAVSGGLLGSVGCAALHAFSGYWNTQIPVHLTTYLHLHSSLLTNGV